MQVVEASDGEQALDYLASCDPSALTCLPDLILLDKNMPGLDGLDALRAMKSNPRWAQIPVVMLTTEGADEFLQEGLRAGAYYYLVKPSSEQVVQCVVQSAVEEARRKESLIESLGRRASGMRLLQMGEFRFRTMQEAKDVALLLADASREPQRTVSGFSEILTNAVEHGLLGIGYELKGKLQKQGLLREEISKRLISDDYRGKEARASFWRAGKELIVTVCDGGQGFDPGPYMQLDPSRAFDWHGRGIALAREESFDSLEYLGNGNTAVIRIFARD